MKLLNENKILKASIIVPTYNSVDQLERALYSLFKLDFDTSNYEIIVVDNGSSDNTVTLVNDFIKNNTSPNLRYIYDDVPGLLSGRHRGTKESLSDILIFVDQDIYAHENWLSSIVETFNRHPEIHIVGGKCLPKFEKEPPAWLNYFWRNLPDGGKLLGELSLCDFGDTEKEIDPTLVWGLNFSIRKRSLYELEGFNPDATPPFQQCFQGDGETGLSLKAIKKGYKALYQPKALVYHEVPATRMTLDYFDKRFFYQGICNSYTEIRRNNGIVSSSLQRIIKTKVKIVLQQIYGVIFLKTKASIKSENNFEKEMLMTRFRTMERAGYNFHHEMAQKNPVVLNWVLKDNYFDYELPKIEIC